jgi:hypothetical protein
VAQAKPAAAGPVAPGKLNTPVQTTVAMEAASMESFEKKIRPALVQYCYECHSHSAKKSLGSLYLDSRKGMMQGGAHGAALMPGEPDKSRLIEAVRYGKPDLLMPPKSKLPDRVVTDLAEWVKRGAPWPAERDPATAPASADNSAAEQKKRKHWAWQPVHKPLPPAVKQKTWPKNPIDQFILAKLEAHKLTPQPRADRRTLLRRAYFDLIGLPPTPEEADTFLNDTSPNAWPNLVDRLLASPHYGERWGRYWLDVARYGEDQAHSFEPRLYPQGFRYRDWIAKSLNSDMPYDRFVKEQIAADLLNEPDKMDQLPALGFFAVGPVYYGDSKMYDQYDDRIDTLSRGFLGLTVACARCHDHKFDPITQKDYYGLAGVFASTNYVEVALSEPSAKGGSAASAGNRAELIKAKQDEVDKFTTEQIQRIRKELVPQSTQYVVAAWKLLNRRKAGAKVSVDAVSATEKVEPIILERWFGFLTGPNAKDRTLLAPWRRMLEQQDAHADLSASAAPLADARKTASELQAAVQVLIARRDAAKAGGGKDKSTAPELAKADLDALEELVGDEGVLTVHIEHLEKFLTGDPRAHYAILKPALERLKMGSFVHALADSSKAANVHILLRGNADTPGDETPRRFLSILAGENAAAFTQGSGRLELANAIADKNNPLTARVMVNRIWQHHFGRGLVRTTSNFGMLGEPPTHPELLDYLAARFMESGWSLKSLHREIMLSGAYQTSSADNAKNDEIDPDDQLLWRTPRKRLDIEAWRDAMLAVSGKLDATVGGPSVSLSSPDNNRRTYYAAVSRHDLDSMLRLFDFPDPNATTDARMTTTVPLQQLFVLNGEFMIRQARALAARLTAEPAESDADRVRRAFLLVFNRLPLERELALGLAFLQAPQSGSAPVLAATGGASAPPAQSANRLSRWEEYAQVLLSANEFMYVD